MPPQLRLIKAGGIKPSAPVSQRAAGRPKNLEVIAELEALREEIERDEEPRRA